MSNARSIIDRAVNWLVANTRSFGYLLPDTLELALYFGIAVYFTVQFAQQQG
jgi:hypothetical protein